MKTKYFFIILFFITNINLSYTQCPIIADFDYNRLCINGQVQFIDQSYFINPGLITNWHWDFGDGTTSNLQNPLHNFLSDNTYIVTLIATDSSGCNDTVIQSVYVNNLPNASFSLSSINICSGSIVSLNNTSTGLGLNYHWDFGDGNESLIANPSHTYIYNGSGYSTHSIQLIVTDSNGCGDTATQTINVHSLPEADFTDGKSCLGTPTNFISTSTTTSGTINNWNWDFGDGIGTASGQNVSYLYNNPGTYNVTLIVTTNYGCTDTITHPVQVNILPTASFSFNPNNACSGSTISFNNSSIGSGLTYLWNFGDGNTSTAVNPSHIFYSKGCGSYNYPVNLTVTDINGCTNNISMNVTILQEPDVLFVENNGFTFCHTDTSFISDTAIVYNYSADISCISSYSVDWGDGSPVEIISLPFDNSHPIQHIYNSLGYYIVTYTATGNNGCTAVFHDTAAVESSPVASIIGPSTGTNIGCGPLEVCVTNMSQNITPTTIMQIDWDDGTTEILSPTTIGDTICHVYHLSGCNNGVMNNYAITITASNTCDYSSVSWAPVRIYGPPQASFTVNSTNACVGQSIIITNTSIPNSCASSTFTSYFWDFGDGTTYGPTIVDWNVNPQQTINHTYSDTGHYVITLTATNNSTNGCGSTSYNTTINIGDTYAEFIADTVCYGNPTHFTDLSWTNFGTITSWYWNFGDGYTSTSQNPSHSFNSAGNYNVCLTVTSNYGCSNTICHQVHVDTLPYVNFSNTTACLHDTTFFTNLSHGYSAAIISNQWDFGDGTTSTDINPIHVYTSAGSFNVTLTVTDVNGCSNSTVHPVTVNPLPVANFTSDDVCLGNISNFSSTSTTSSGSIVSYQWDFGDGSPMGSGNNVTHLYGDTGTYYVTHIVSTNNGCIDSIVLPVRINANPLADFSADTACAGTATIFTDLSDPIDGILNYWNWNFGDGSNSNVQNPTHIYASGGNYNTCLMVRTTLGCSNTICHQVHVDTLPYVNFSNTTACLHDTTFFTNLSHGYSAAIISNQWDFGDGTTSTDINPIHVYTSAGSFNVTLTVTDVNGCSNSTVHPVTVNPLPVANFTSDDVCLGNISNFSSTSTTSSGSIVSYQWDFGDGSPMGSGNNVTHLYGDTGTYYVTHIVSTNNGCIDSIVLPVRINANPLADFSADTACAGTATIFTDLSDPIDGILNYWNWNFGDGSNSNVQNPTHIYASGGNYNVQLIVRNIYGCIDTINKNIIVKPTPTTNFSFDNACFGTSNNFYDASSHNATSIISWQWDFGDSSISNIQNPSHTYSNYGIYNVSLIVENDMGCFDTMYQNVEVYANPIADFVASVACIGFPTSFQDLSTPLGGTITTWQWNFGDGVGTSNLQNPSWTFSSGTPPYSVSLIISDIHGCTDSITHSINLYPQPTALFTVNNVCSKDTAHFIDQSFSSNGSIVAWNWNFGDGIGTSNLQNPNYLYSQVSSITTVNPFLIVTDSNGCTDTISNTVTIFPQPIADFIADTVCSGNYTHFTDASSPVAGSLISWQWDFGDGIGTSNIQNPSYLYNPVNNITNFNVSLITTNNNGCKDTTSRTIIVNPLPNPNFIANAACSGDITMFTDLSYSNGGPITQWSWNFGDGIGNSNIQNPSYTYAPVYSITNFNVSLNVTDSNACTNDTTITIVVNPLPIAEFSVNPTCSGYQSIFNDLSTSNGGNITEWYWDFGDGIGISNQQNPAYLYPATSTIDYYTVILVVKDINGCIDTVSHQTMIIPSPNASFISDTVCSGNLAHFIDNSTTIGGTITGWNWNFGDGIGISNQQNPSYLYQSVSNTTNYNVELIITNSYGCKDTNYNIATVYPLPIANFNNNIACFGNPTEFIDLSTSNGGNLNSWHWTFGDGNSTNQQNPQHTYSDFGYFPVTLTVTDINSCVDDTTKTIVVDSLPIPSFTWTATCTQGIINFTNTSNGNGSNIISYLWDFGDGFMSNVENPIHYYFNNGNYNVSLTVTNDRGCSDSIDILVSVNEGLNLDFYASDVCFGESMYFYYNLINPFVQPATWLWSFGDGTYSTDPQPVHFYQQPGTYNVLLTVTDNLGCDLTITHQITVFASPIANFSANIAQIGSPTIFSDLSTTANGNLISWHWDFGDGSTSNQQNPQHFYNNAGNYLVTLIVINNFGCSDTFSLNVLVTEVINVDFTMNPNPVCINQPVYFTDISTTGTGNFISWHWNFGDGYISTSQHPIHSYLNPGTYYVSLIATSSLNLSDTAVHQLVVVDAPIANFTYEPLNPILSENIYFTDLSIGATQWHWYFGDDTHSYIPNPIHTYYNLGLYDVSLTVTNEYGCKDTVYQTVIPYDNEMIYFPNAIHINGDGINDVFNVIGTGWSPENFELRIFNRWGEQIYFTTDINAGWDGTDNRTGEKVQIGVYIWKVQIMDFANNVKKYVGYVSVIL